MEYPGSRANTGRSSVNDGRTVVHRDMLAGDAHPMCLKNTLSGALSTLYLVFCSVMN